MRKQLLLILAICGLIAFAPAHAADTSKESNEMSAGKLSLFPILPRGATADALPQLVPVANNHPLGGVHKGLTRVIIGIHDATRNAQGMVTVLSTIGGPSSESTLILAPQFLAYGDAETYYPDMPEALRKTLAIWPPEDWVIGGETTVDKPLRPISSFTVLDLILMYLGERNNFPDLKDIFIAGHGNGADFTQRYAALGIATPYLEKEGIAVHFVVANASTYLYLTPARPKPDALGFSSTALAGCTPYDYYRYGLVYLNSYAKALGQNAIKERYGDRRVIYLVGENIGMADPDPDESCSAYVEGPNRFSRAINYYAYIYQLYGEAVTKRQKAYKVLKTAYNPVAMLGSPCGKSVLFNDGSACENSITPSQEILK